MFHVEKVIYPILKKNIQINCKIATDEEVPKPSSDDDKKVEANEPTKLATEDFKSETEEQRE